MSIYNRRSHSKKISEIETMTQKKIENEKLKNNQILEATLQQEKQTNEKERSEIRNDFQKMFNER